MSSIKENLISELIKIDSKEKPISYGAHCRVYNYSEDLILKVINFSCSGQHEFIRYCKGKDSKHLPMIENILTRGRKTYVLMERLEEITGALQFKLQEREDNTKSFERETYLWRGISKSLDSVLDDMEMWFCSEEYDWDLHSGNVMVRPSDKQIVIIDPWA